MNTTYLEVPGGHDWRAFSAAFARELAWLGHPMGLTP
jgi:S-formylglutathione hydrolase FrmB